MAAADKDINRILALHLSGEKLTDEQMEVLTDWVYRNKEEYARLAAIMQAGTGTVRKDFNSKEAWDKVETRLKGPAVSRFHRIRTYLLYAACLVLIIGTTLFLLTRGRNDRNTYSNPTESLMTLFLPDSTLVTLYPRAEVTFLAKAEDNERATELEGKAFFKVRRDTERPFIISCNGTRIQVLGTAFLVDGTDGSATGIFVREGLVRFSTDTEEVMLRAEEQAVTQGIRITRSRIADPEKFFERHPRQRTYRNVPLSQVIHDLEDAFGIQVSCNGRIRDNRISTRLEFRDIDEILSEISFICNISCRKLSDKKYEFYKP